MPPRKKPLNYAAIHKALQDKVDSLTWGDDDWLPAKDRVSDQDLQDLWESAPDVSKAFHVVTTTDNHTYIVAESPVNREYRYDLEDTLVALKADKEDLHAAVNNGIAIIADLRKQLVEAKKPDETEALAALREDTSRVQAKLRDEIKDLKARLEEQTKRAKDLQQQLDRRKYQFADLHRTARRLADNLSDLTVAEDPLVPQRLTGVLGDAQRAIEDAMGGTPAPTAPSPPIAPPGQRSGFCNLEID